MLVKGNPEVSDLIIKMTHNNHVMSFDVSIITTVASFTNMV